MTLAEMQQMTVNHWNKHFRGQTQKMGQEEVLKQALACARLTRLEMDSLKAVGLDEETAWTEARNLFCLAPPSIFDHLQTAQ